MVLSIEQHVEWISDCIGYLRNRQLASIEATVEAENAWVAHVNEMASYTLLPRVIRGIWEQIFRTSHASLCLTLVAWESIDINVK